MPTSTFVLLVGCVVFTAGCPRRDVGQMMRDNLEASTGRGPKVLAVYMPWFGDRNHIDVGYSSHDPAVLRQQIQQARDLGVSGFVVDWNGPRHTYSDRAFALLQSVARQTSFQVALLYNEAADDTGQGSEDAIAALDKAYRDYLGPQAPQREAYLTYQGRPVVFIFPKRGGTDWNRVREHVNQWFNPPLLLYKDEPPPQFASAFDGYYPWVHPGHGGWRADGTDWGKQYLKDFYKRMSERYPQKLAVGGAWPGFDDSSAAWGLNRRMDPRCGKTFDDTLKLFRDFTSESAAMPFLLIQTWNDYEEGTAIERSTAWDCSSGRGAAQQSAGAH